jgi:hypothetical protein
VAPFARHRFVFENPAVEVYDVPPLAGTGALGLSMRLP